MQKNRLISMLATVLLSISASAQGDFALARSAMPLAQSKNFDHADELCVSRDSYSLCRRRLRPHLRLLLHPPRRDDARREYRGRTKGGEIKYR